MYVAELYPRASKLTDGANFYLPRSECLVEFPDFIWLTVDGKSN